MSAIYPRSDARGACWANQVWPNADRPVWNGDSGKTDTLNGRQHTPLTADAASAKNLRALPGRPPPSLATVPRHKPSAFAPLKLYVGRARIVDQLASCSTAISPSRARRPCYPIARTLRSASRRGYARVTAGMPPLWRGALVQSAESIRSHSARFNFMPRAPLCPAPWPARRIPPGPLQLAGLVDSARP